MIRIGISALSLLLFAMHVQGSTRFEIIDRIENYLHDVRVRLTMPGTIDERIVIVRAPAAKSELANPKPLFVTGLTLARPLAGVQCLYL